MLGRLETITSLELLLAVHPAVHTSLGDKTLAMQGKNYSRWFSMEIQKTLPPSVIHSVRDPPQSKTDGAEVAACVSAVHALHDGPSHAVGKAFNLWTFSQGTPRQIAFSKHGSHNISHPSCSSDNVTLYSPPIHWWGQVPLPLFGDLWDCFDL